MTDSYRLAAARRLAGDLETHGYGYAAMAARAIADGTACKMKFINVLRACKCLGWCGADIADIERYVKDQGWS